MLSGNPDGLVSLPNTRKGWLRLTLLVVLMAALVFVALSLAGRTPIPR